MIPKFQNPSAPITYDMPMMREITVTPNGNQIGPVSSDQMLYDLQQAQQHRKLKDAKNNYILQHNMSKAQSNFAKGIFEVASAPASFNPVVGGALGAVYAGTAAKDIKDNGLNWSNGLQLGLSLPFLGHAGYVGFQGVRRALPKVSKTNSLISDNSIISGPKTSLQNWDFSEPGKVKMTSQQLKRLFNKRKQDILNYVRGDEFKQRVINSNQFTEKDYSDLVKEIDYVLKKSHYVGRNRGEGAYNTYQVASDGTPYFDSFITLSDYHSPIQQKANIWHELWHSIGGRNKYRQKGSFPQLNKLQKYNNSLKVSENPRLTEYVIQTQDNWYHDNILSRPREIRSRASAFLDFLRNSGYDTKALLSDPGELAKYLNDIKNKKIQVPWDISQLVQSIDFKSLAKYMSKVLGISTGTYIAGTNLNTNNYGNKQ